MTGAATELPSASASLNFGPGTGIGLGRTGIESGNSPSGATQSSRLGANGASESTLTTGSKSFLDNWQAMLASMEGSAGSEENETSAEDEAAGLAGQMGRLASNAPAVKESSAAAGNGAPTTPANLSPSISALSPEKLARLQQFAALIAVASADYTAKSASSAASSETNGGYSSRSTKTSGESNSSKAATASPESLPISPNTEGMVAAVNSQAALASTRRADSGSGLAANGRGLAMTPDSGFPSADPVVSGSNGQSNPLAVSGSPSNVTAESSGTEAGASSNGLDSLAAANGTLMSESAYASGAVSVDGAQPVEASAAASIASTGRGAGSESKNSTDLPARTVQRSQRASSTDIAAQVQSQGTELSPGNSASPAIGSSAYSLAISGAGSGSTSGSAAGAPGSATAASANETFTALDGDAPVGGFSWTHAGANRAEAGFEDPTLGWVGVRADLGGGGVHASLVPGSIEAAQTLGSHLAGLNEYLAERHPAVGTVTVAGHENGGAATRAQSESGAHSGSQSPNPDSAGNSGSGNPNASDSSNNSTAARSNPVSNPGEGIARARSTNSAFPAANPAAETYGRSSGSYISVMA